jgi:hypothetical protein
MSEFTKSLWAVVSERGCEASDLNYEEALALMNHLTQEKVSGLAIVTNSVASRFTRPTPLTSQSVSSNTARRKA